MYLSTPNLLSGLTINWLSLKIKYIPLSEGLSGVGRNDLFSLGLQFCNIPDAPTITAPMIAGPGSLTVAWTAPAVGPSVVAYDLRYIRTDADDIVNANWTLAEEVWAIGFNPLEYVLTGLAAPTQYNVQMRAVNAAGNGPWSATVVGTPSAWGPSGLSPVHTWNREMRCRSPSP